MGAGSLTPLLALSQAGQVRVTVAGVDAAALERLSRRLPAVPRLSSWRSTPRRRAINGSAAISRWFKAGACPAPKGRRVLGKIAEQVGPNGVVLSRKPAADPVIDFLIGTDAACSGAAPPIRPCRSGQVPRWMRLSSTGASRLPRDPRGALG